MEPQRRRADLQPWIVRYWPLFAFLFSWFVAGVLAFAHLENDVQSLRNRSDYHWGKEW